uniref:S-adenosylmethionine:tRNA ribosyltransferase-isomerase n=1 Tax=Roseihalotalea indica TaxID=2867963 RepID=A0AA49JF34_9BACT|nr:S-adenosylmethionine:tRNA ribosyltransferase-isomerase [Tunicatimonas sp. TK19036]
MSLSLTSYDYPLPDERIAKHPLAHRDQAKLLVYQQGKIQDQHFYNLPDWLPEKSCLCFNNTKVIPARLHFRKPTTEQGLGALIEVLLLHPIAPSTVMSQAMSATQTAIWECMIGNLKKWKADQEILLTLPIKGKDITLRATLADRTQKHVQFQWDGDASFAEVVEAAGKVPLPPYLHRESTEEDRQRYQTVYSKTQGAVAAPTAGLHFTDDVLEQLRKKGVTFNELTLHVGAGTFQPIKEDNIQNHAMHSEQMVVSRENIEMLLNPSGPVMAVGTTSLRTMESLYWFGVLLSHQPEAAFQIPKLYPYQHEADQLPSRNESMQMIREYMDRKGLETLVGETEIFIFPGYIFRVCQGLITNFHLPKSTLILLIAAFVGDDWNTIYQYALEHDYRFLSYGDSSLLFPNPTA